MQIWTNFNTDCRFQRLTAKKTYKQENPAVGKEDALLLPCYAISY